MAPTIQHVVNIFLDFDRESLVLSPAWIKERFRLFQATTLKSLLNQLDDDFEIWVYCGLRNRAMTESFDWHPRVIPLWDKGKERLASLNADFLSITRLDSDDLMHRLAVSDMKVAAQEMAAYGQDRAVAIFRRNLCYDHNNGFIGFHYRKAPPFFTHVFPQRIFRDFGRYDSLHFTTHGTSGAGQPGAVVLPSHRICIIKHTENISDIRRTRPYMVYSRDEIEQKLLAEAILTNDPEGVRATLQEFGVTQEDWQ